MATVRASGRAGGNVVLVALDAAVARADGQGRVEGALGVGAARGPEPDQERDENDEGENT